MNIRCLFYPGDADKLHTVAGICAQIKLIAAVPVAVDIIGYTLTQDVAATGLL